MHWLKTLGIQLRRTLVRSSFIHLRDEPANNITELVGLMDRFLFDGVRYPLEWDDFISWPSDNVHLEQIRLEATQLEPLLFSKNADERKQYRAELLKIRNRLAGPLGIAPRSDTD